MSRTRKLSVVCLSWTGTALDLMFSALTILTFDADTHASPIALQNAEKICSIKNMDSEDSQQRQERLRRRRKRERDARARETAEQRETRLARRRERYIQGTEKLEWTQKKNVRL